MSEATLNVRILGRQRGVTLIELMTVVMIIAVIATIAIPTYRRYLLRSQRSEAKIALLQLQTAQEKFYLQNNAYTDKISDKAPTGLGLTTTTVNGFYTISLSMGTNNQSYTATAAPTSSGGQSSDKECSSFSITDFGKRDVSGGTKDSVFCWK